MLAIVAVALTLAFIDRFHPVLLGIFVAIVLATGMMPIIDRLCVLATEAEVIPARPVLASLPRMAILPAR